MGPQSGTAAKLCASASSEDLVESVKRGETELFHSLVAQAERGNADAWTGLVSLAKQGNAEAWKFLVDKHQPPILRQITRLCGDPDWAEDLTQNVFVLTIRRIGQFEGRDGAKFGTWLYSIARHHTLTELSKKSKEEKRTQRQSAEVPIERSDEGQQSLSMINNWQLEEALQMLPEGQREAVMLKDICGCEILEVANRMNLAPAEVKKLCHKGRERLKAILGKDRRL